MFPQDSAYDDGLNPWCAECVKARRHEQEMAARAPQKDNGKDTDVTDRKKRKGKRRRPPEGPVAQAGTESAKTKTCSKCKETKPHKEFYNSKASKDGKTYWCRKCMNAASEKARKDKKGTAAAATTTPAPRRTRAPRSNSEAVEVMLTCPDCKGKAPHRCTSSVALAREVKRLRAELRKVQRAQEAK
jgi:hypothetical protein